MGLGKNIKLLMSLKDVTQKEISNLCSVTQSAVSLWIKEERQPPIEKIKELAEFFDISVDLLVSDTDEFLEKINKSVPIYEISADAEEFLNLFSALPQKLQKQIKELIQTITSRKDVSDDNTI